MSISVSIRVCTLDRLACQMDDSSKQIVVNTLPGSVQHADLAYRVDEYGPQVDRVPYYGVRSALVSETPDGHVPAGDVPIPSLAQPSHWASIDVAPSNPSTSTNNVATAAVAVNAAFADVVAQVSELERPSDALETALRVPNDTKQRLLKQTTPIVEAMQDQRPIAADRNAQNARLVASMHTTDCLYAIHACRSLPPEASVGYTFGLLSEQLVEMSANVFEAELDRYSMEGIDPLNTLTESTLVRHAGPTHDYSYDHALNVDASHAGGSTHADPQEVPDQHTTVLVVEAVERFVVVSASIPTGTDVAALLAADMRLCKDILRAIELVSSHTETSVKEEATNAMLQRLRTAIGVKGTVDMARIPIAATDRATDELVQQIAQRLQRILSKGLAADLAGVVECVQLPDGDTNVRIPLVMDACTRRFGAMNTLTFLDDTSSEAFGVTVGQAQASAHQLYFTSHARAGPAIRDDAFSFKSISTTTIECIWKLKHRVAMLSVLALPRHLEELGNVTAKPMNAKRLDDLMEGLSLALRDLEMHTSTLFAECDTDRSKWSNASESSSSAQRQVGKDCTLALAVLAEAILISANELVERLHADEPQTRSQILQTEALFLAVLGRIQGLEHGLGVSCGLAGPALRSPAFEPYMRAIGLPMLAALTTGMSGADVTAAAVQVNSIVPTGQDMFASDVVFRSRASMECSARLADVARVVELATNPSEGINTWKATPYEWTGDVLGFDNCLQLLSERFSDASSLAWNARTLCARVGDRLVPSHSQAADRDRMQDCLQEHGCNLLPYLDDQGRMLPACAVQSLLMHMLALELRLLMVRRTLMSEAMAVARWITALEDEKTAAKIPADAAFWSGLGGSELYQLLHQNAPFSQLRSRVQSIVEERAKLVDSCIRTIQPLASKMSKLVLDCQRAYDTALSLDQSNGVSTLRAAQLDSMATVLIHVSSECQHMASVFVMDDRLFTKSVVDPLHCFNAMAMDVAALVGAPTTLNKLRCSHTMLTPAPNESLAHLQQSSLPDLSGQQALDRKRAIMQHSKNGRGIDSIATELAQGAGDAVAVSQASAIELGTKSAALVLDALLTHTCSPRTIHAARDQALVRALLDSDWSAIEVQDVVQTVGRHWEDRYTPANASAYGQLVVSVFGHLLMQSLQQVKSAERRLYARGTASAVTMRWHTLDPSDMDWDALAVTLQSLLQGNKCLDTSDATLALVDGRNVDMRSATQNMRCDVWRLSSIVATRACLANHQATLRVIDDNPHDPKNSAVAVSAAALTVALATHANTLMPAELDALLGRALSVDDMVATIVEQMPTVEDASSCLLRPVCVLTSIHRLSVARPCPLDHNVTRNTANEQGDFQRVFTMQQEDMLIAYSFECPVDAHSLIQTALRTLTAETNSHVDPAEWTSAVVLEMLCVGDRNVLQETMDVLRQDHLLDDPSYSRRELLELSDLVHVSCPSATNSAQRRTDYGAFNGILMDASNSRMQGFYLSEVFMTLLRQDGFVAVGEKEWLVRVDCMRALQVDVASTNTADGEELASISPFSALHPDARSGLRCDVQPPLVGIDLASRPPPIAPMAAPNTVARNATRQTLAGAWSQAIFAFDQLLLPAIAVCVDGYETVRDMRDEHRSHVQDHHGVRRVGAGHVNTVWDVLCAFAHAERLQRSKSMRLSDKAVRVARDAGLGLVLGDNVLWDDPERRMRRWAGGTLSNEIMAYASLSTASPTSLNQPSSSGENARIGEAGDRWTDQASIGGVAVDRAVRSGYLRVLNALVTGTSWALTNSMMGEMSALGYLPLVGMLVQQLTQSVIDYQVAIAQEAAYDSVGQQPPIADRAMLMDLRSIAHNSDVQRMDANQLSDESRKLLRMYLYKQLYGQTWLMQSGLFLVIAALTLATTSLLSADSDAETFTLATKVTFRNTLASLLTMDAQRRRVMNAIDPSHQTSGLRWTLFFPQYALMALDGVLSYDVLAISKAPNLDVTQTQTVINAIKYSTILGFGSIVSAIGRLTLTFGRTRNAMTTEQDAAVGSSMCMSLAGVGLFLKDYIATPFALTGLSPMLMSFMGGDDSPRSAWKLAVSQYSERLKLFFGAVIGRDVPTFQFQQRVDPKDASTFNMDGLSMTLLDNQRASAQISMYAALLNNDDMMMYIDQRLAQDNNWLMGVLRTISMQSLHIALLSSSSLSLLFSPEAAVSLSIALASIRNPAIGPASLAAVALGQHHMHKHLHVERMNLAPTFQSFIWVGMGVSTTYALADAVATVSSRRLPTPSDDMGVLQMASGATLSGVARAASMDAFRNHDNVHVLGMGHETVTNTMKVASAAQLSRISQLLASRSSTHHGHALRNSRVLAWTVYGLLGMLWGLLIYNRLHLEARGEAGDRTYVDNDFNAIFTEMYASATREGDVSSHSFFYRMWTMLTSGAWDTTQSRVETSMSVQQAHQLADASLLQLSTPSSPLSPMLQDACAPNSSFPPLTPTGIGGRWTSTALNPTSVGVNGPNRPAAAASKSPDVEYSLVNLEALCQTRFCDNLLRSLPAAQREGVVALDQGQNVLSPNVLQNTQTYEEFFEDMCVKLGPTNVANEVWRSIGCTRLEPTRLADGTLATIIVLARYATAVGCTGSLQHKLISNQVQASIEHPEYASVMQCLRDDLDAKRAVDAIEMARNPDVSTVLERIGKVTSTTVDAMKTANELANTIRVTRRFPTAALPLVSRSSYASRCYLNGLEITSMIRSAANGARDMLSLTNWSYLPGHVDDLISGNARRGWERAQLARWAHDNVMQPNESDLNAAARMATLARALVAASVCCCLKQARHADLTIFEFRTCTISDDNNTLNMIDPDTTYDDALRFVLSHDLHHPLSVEVRLNEAAVRAKRFEGVVKDVAYTPALSKHSMHAPLFKYGDNAVVASPMESMGCRTGMAHEPSVHLKVPQIDEHGRRADAVACTVALYEPTYSLAAYIPSIVDNLRDQDLQLRVNNLYEPAHADATGSPIKHRVQANAIHSLAVANLLQRQQQANSSDIKLQSTSDEISLDAFVRLLVTRPLDKGNVTVDTLQWSKMAMQLVYSMVTVNAGGSTVTDAVLKDVILFQLLVYIASPTSTRLSIGARCVERSARRGPLGFGVDLVCNTVSMVYSSLAIMMYSKTVASPIKATGLQTGFYAMQLFMSMSMIGMTAYKYSRSGRALQGIDDVLRTMSSAVLHGDERRLFQQRLQFYQSAIRSYQTAVSLPSRLKVHALQTYASANPNLERKQPWMKYLRYAGMVISLFGTGGYRIARATDRSTQSQRMELSTRLQSMASRDDKFKQLATDVLNLDFHKDKDDAADFERLLSTQIMPMLLTHSALRKQTLRIVDIPLRSDSYAPYASSFLSVLALKAAAFVAESASLPAIQLLKEGGVVESADDLQSRLDDAADSASQEAVVSNALDISELRNMLLSQIARRIQGRLLGTQNDGRFFQATHEFKKTLQASYDTQSVVNTALSMTNEKFIDLLVNIQKTDFNLAGKHVKASVTFDRLAVAYSTDMSNAIKARLNDLIENIVVVDYRATATTLLKGVLDQFELTLPSNKTVQWSEETTTSKDIMTYSADRRRAKHKMVLFHGKTNPKSRQDGYLLDLHDMSLLAPPWMQSFQAMREAQQRGLVLSVTMATAVDQLATMIKETNDPMERVLKKQIRVKAGHDITQASAMLASLPLVNDRLDAKDLREPLLGVQMPAVKEYVFHAIPLLLDEQIDGKDWVYEITLPTTVYRSSLHPDTVSYAITKALSGLSMLVASFEASVVLKQVDQMLKEKSTLIAKVRRMFEIDVFPSLAAAAGDSETTRRRILASLIRGSTLIRVKQMFKVDTTVDATVVLAELFAASTQALALGIQTHSNRVSASTLDEAKQMLRLSMVPTAYEPSLARLIDQLVHSPSAGQEDRVRVPSGGAEATQPMMMFLTDAWRRDSYLYRMLGDRGLEGVSRDPESATDLSGRPEQAALLFDKANGLQLTPSAIQRLLFSYIRVVTTSSVREKIDVATASESLQGSVVKVQNDQSLARTNALVAGPSKVVSTHEDVLKKSKDILDELRTSLSSMHAHALEEFLQSIDDKVSADKFSDGLHLLSSSASKLTDMQLLSPQHFVYKWLSYQSLQDLNKIALPPLAYTASRTLEGGEKIYLERDESPDFQAFRMAALESAHSIGERAVNKLVSKLTRALKDDQATLVTFKSNLIKLDAEYNKQMQASSNLAAGRSSSLKNAVMKLYAHELQESIKQTLSPNGSYGLLKQLVDAMLLSMSDKDAQERPQLHTQLITQRDQLARLQLNMQEVGVLSLTPEFDALGHSVQILKQWQSEGSAANAAMSSEIGQTIDALVQMSGVLTSGTSFEPSSASSTRPTASQLLAPQFSIQLMTVLAVQTPIVMLREALQREFRTTTASVIIRTQVAVMAAMLVASVQSIVQPRDGTAIIAAYTSPAIASVLNALVFAICGWVTLFSTFSKNAMLSIPLQGEEYPVSVRKAAFLSQFSLPSSGKQTRNGCILVGDKLTSETPPGTAHTPPLFNGNRLGISYNASTKPTVDVSLCVAMQHAVEQVGLVVRDALSRIGDARIGHVGVDANSTRAAVNSIDSVVLVDQYMSKVGMMMAGVLEPPKSTGVEAYDGVANCASLYNFVNASDAVTETSSVVGALSRLVCTAALDAPLHALQSTRQFEVDLANRYNWNQRAQALDLRQLDGNVLQRSPDALSGAGWPSLVLAPALRTAGLLPDSHMSDNTSAVRLSEDGESFHLNDAMRLAIAGTFSSTVVQTPSRTRTEPAYEYTPTSNHVSNLIKYSQAQPGRRRRNVPHEMVLFNRHFVTESASDRVFGTTPARMDSPSTDNVVRALMRLDVANDVLHLDDISFALRMWTSKQQSDSVGGANSEWQAVEDLRRLQASLASIATVVHKTNLRPQIAYLRSQASMMKRSDRTDAARIYGRCFKARAIGRCIESITSGGPSDANKFEFPDSEDSTYRVLRARCADVNDPSWNVLGVSLPTGVKPVSKLCDDVVVVCDMMLQNPSNSRDINDLSAELLRDIRTLSVACAQARRFYAQDRDESALQMTVDGTEAVVHRIMLHDVNVLLPPCVWTDAILFA